MYNPQFIYVYSNNPNKWTDEPLYIGLHSRGKVFTRHSEHLYKKDPQCDDFAKIRFLYIALLPTVISIKNIEQYLIEKYAPPMNTKDNPDTGHVLDYEGVQIEGLENAVKDLVWIRFETDEFNGECIYDSITSIYSHIESQAALRSFPCLSDCFKYLSTLPSKKRKNQVYADDIDAFVCLENENITFYESLIGKHFIKLPIKSWTKTHFHIDADALDPADFYENKKSIDVADYDYIKNFDGTEYTPVSEYLENIDLYYETQGYKWHDKIESVISPVANIIANDPGKSSQKRILHCLNKTDVNGENILRKYVYCSIYQNDNASVRLNNSIVNLRYLDPVNKLYRNTDIYEFNTKSNLWEFKECVSGYDPDEEDIYIPLCGQSSRVPVHIKYFVDNSIEVTLSQECNNKLVNIFANEIIPLCKKVADLEPAFSAKAKLINFINDIETGEAISEDDTDSIAKIGDGYNFRNHDLIFYQLGARLMSFTSYRFLDIFNNTKRRKENRHVSKELVVNGLVPVGYYDLLEYSPDNRIKEIVSDINNLTLHCLVNKYEHV